MIHDPDSYIDSLCYNGDLKTIIRQVARHTLHGRRAQMSWLHLCRSIGKSRRTLAKLLNSDQFNTVLKRIRRGKKQTNLYYLRSWLWERLIQGRRVPHGQHTHAEARPAEPARKAGLLDLYVKELAKLHPVGT